MYDPNVRRIVKIKNDSDLEMTNQSLSFSKKANLFWQDKLNNMTDSRQKSIFEKFIDNSQVDSEIYQDALNFYANNGFIEEE